MKRDMNLFRKLLIAIEAYKQNAFMGPVATLAPNDDPAAIMLHINLLCDKGLATMIDDPDEQADGLVRGLRLTAIGYDFLDAIREEAAYGRLLAEIQKRWPDLAIAYAVKLLGL